LTEMMATHVPGVRVTVRQPNVTGELAKLVNVIAAHGWGILTCGGVPSPQDPTKWDAVIKIRHVPQEEIIAALKTIDGQEIVDVRKV